MHLSHRLNHSSCALLQHHSRCMCTALKHTIHASRAAPPSKQHAQQHAQQHSNTNTTLSSHAQPKSRATRSSQYPARFSDKHRLTQRQKNLLLTKILTHTSSSNVLYSEHANAHNHAYFANLVIDMVYSTYCATRRGISLRDESFKQQWHRFIVNKFSAIFSAPHQHQLDALVQHFMQLPPFLSDYNARLNFFVCYEYDRITFRKPVYIYPSDSFMLSIDTWDGNKQHANSLHQLHDERNPYLRHSKLYEYTAQEVYARLAFLFEPTQYPKGLYLHELANVFEYEHGNVLSLKSVEHKKLQQTGVESLALNALFEDYYQSHFSFHHKVSLRQLVQNAGLLCADNQHTDRVMMFANNKHGRFQHALLDILKNSDYLHTLNFVRQRLKENYADLYAELRFERMSNSMFAHKMLQYFSPLIHIYRASTINRYYDERQLKQRMAAARHRPKNEDEDDANGNGENSRMNANGEIQQKSEVIGNADFFDLRYQRRYPHCLRVFHKHFNERLYNLVRAVCKQRMLRYDTQQFVIGNFGVKLSELEEIWQDMYPTEMYPFYGNEYALFYHIIEYQSHNIRAIPIDNFLHKNSKSEKSEKSEPETPGRGLAERHKEQLLMREVLDEDVRADLEFSGLFVAGSQLLTRARSLYNRHQQVYYHAYHFVPVQPYNNLTHERLVDTKNLLHRHKQQQQQRHGNRPDRTLTETMDNLKQLKKQYTDAISYVLKTFRHDGVPLSDFARLFEFKYHNAQSQHRGMSRALISFNPDVIAATIDVPRGLMYVGDVHQSLSNLLVVWGALITPKNKSVQQQLVFPLQLGCMDWLIVSSMDYVDHRSLRHCSRDGQSLQHSTPHLKSFEYNVPWTTVKEIGQQSNNRNSTMYHRRNQTFGDDNSVDIKVWTKSDTEWIKQQCFYKLSSNLTLLHSYIHTPHQLRSFWPNVDANLKLFRRPIAPILDYDNLSSSLLFESNAAANAKYAPYKNIAFHVFIDNLMEKFAPRLRNAEQDKHILFDFLSVMTMRVCYTLWSYIVDYKRKIHFLRWSTFMNRYEAMFGRLVLPNLQVEKAPNLLFAILSSLHCNVIDFIGRKEYVENYLIQNGHFEIPHYRGLNQLSIQFPTNFERKYLRPMFAPKLELHKMDLSIDMERYHQQFVPISFLLSKEMLNMGAYNQTMMNADIATDTWKQSGSFYALSMDPLTRNTIQAIMNETNETPKRWQRSADAPDTVIDKFQRILSRQVYSVASIKEVLTALTDEQWQLLSDALLRHLIDGFVARGELSHAYQMLMSWFKDRLAHRYELYTHLCLVHIHHGDLATAYEIFRYLHSALLELHDKRASNDDYDYDAKMLTYAVCQCCNQFVPKLVENGQFYMFDDLVRDTLSLYRAHNIITQHDLDAMLSNKNVKLLFRVFSRNELLSRLLTLFSFVEQKTIASQAVLLQSTFSMQDIIALLQLSWSSNYRLAQHVMQLIGGVHEYDAAVIDWHSVLQRAIADNMVHYVLNNARMLNIYRQLQTQGYGGAVTLSLTQCTQLVHAYCFKSSSVDMFRLSLPCWQLLVEWMLSAFNRLAHDAAHKLEAAQCINSMMTYFVGVECLSCLKAQNHGDAKQWMELAMQVLKRQTVIVNDAQHAQIVLHGIVLLLQSAATCNELDVFCNIMNELSPNLRHLIHERHFTDIMQCFVNDNMDRLNATYQQSHVWRVSDSSGSSSEDHSRRDKLKQIINDFDQHSNDMHAISHVFHDWIESVKKYQALSSD